MTETRATRLARDIIAAGTRSGIRSDDPLAPLLVAIARLAHFGTKRLGQTDDLLSSTSQGIIDALLRHRLDAQVDHDRLFDRIERRLAQVHVLKPSIASIGTPASRTGCYWRRVRYTVCVISVFTFGAAVGLLVEPYAPFRIGKAADLRSQPASVESEQWRMLRVANDIGKALRRCEEQLIHQQDGRRWCSVPLWLDPPINGKL